MSVPYLNRQLFSDHWLRERLPQRDDYALTPLALARLALWLRGAALQRAEPSGWSAQETVEHIVAPCLALLGYGQGEWLSAHLTLWSQGADLLWRYAPRATASQSPQADATRHTLVGVVAWDADLDARSLPGSERSTRAQAPALLFLRQLAQSEVEWGILTNGRRWRLYARGGATLEASYEIDLPALAASGDMDALQYFWLFFAATAQISPAEGEPSFLQTALRESREYAARIEDDLRARVRRDSGGMPGVGRCAGRGAWRFRRQPLA